MSDSTCALHPSRHPYDTSSKRSQKRLAIALTLCTLFMLVEMAGGYFSGSLAIMTDAIHLLSDVVSLTISLVAIVWGRKPPTPTYSYGYHRAEILGALMSIFMIWIMALFLLLEAIDRLRHPAEVEGKVMLMVAGLGVLVNIVLGIVLYDGHNHHHGHNHSNEPVLPEDPERQNEHHIHGPVQNLNVRAAFVHVLGDLLQSVGVLVAAGIIWWKPAWTIIDPLCTFAFTLIVLCTTGYLVKDMLRVLMEAVPKGLDLVALKADLLKVPGVCEVSDLHVWCLLPGKIVGTCRLFVFKDESHGVLENAQSIMSNRPYRIQHTTIQLTTKLPAHK